MLRSEHHYTMDHFGCHQISRRGQGRQCLFKLLTHMVSSVTFDMNDTLEFLFGVFFGNCADFIT